MKYIINRLTMLNFNILSLFEDIYMFFFRIITVVILWLAPISNYVNLLWILMAINFVTGVVKAIHNGDKFSTKKALYSIIKFILFTLAIIVAFIYQKLINDGTDIAQIIAVILGGFEVFSIYENISIVTGYDIIAAGWKIIKSKIDDYITAIKITKTKQP